MSLRPASLLLLLFAGCASQTAIPAGVRSAIDRQHHGQVVELRQSCYYGDLYDDNDKWLLSPQPFAQVHHIVDLDGQPIHPKNQRGLVRAGTRFVIDEIEFPDSFAVTTRMLTTPRYNIWVYLHPVDERARLPTERSRWVLLLPRDLPDGAAVERELSARLAPEGKMRRWLDGRRPTVRVAIEHKDILAGMNVDELVAAMGEPPLWIENERMNGSRAKVAWYGRREAWLVGGTVVAVEPGRDATAPASP